MQYHDIVVDMLEMGDAPLVDVLVRLAAAMGEDVTVTGDVVTVASWRLAAGETWPGAAFGAWNGLWEGFAELHGAPPGASLTGRRAGAGYEWHV